MMDKKERRKDVLAWHLNAMASMIKEGNYELSDRQTQMIVTLINEINLGKPEPKDTENNKEISRSSIFRDKMRLEHLKMDKGTRLGSENNDIIER